MPRQTAGIQPDEPQAERKPAGGKNQKLLELRNTLRLALPMIVGNCAGMAMGMIDAAMVGRGVGTVALAALGFSTNFVHIPAIAGFGFLSALSVLIAENHGAGRTHECRAILQHGLLLVTFIGIAIFVIVMAGYSLGPYLGWFGQEPVVYTAAGKYIPFFALAWVFIYAGSSFKSFCEAQDHPWTPLIVLIIAIASNVFFNWVFIFGNLGFPALGLKGAGLGTLLANVAFTLMIATTLFSSRRFALSPRNLFLQPFVLSRLVRHLRLGGPTALQIFSEAGAFLLSALIVGALGASFLAAHHIAIQLAAFAFMIPLGVSFAVAIRAGQAYGRKDAAAIRHIAIVAQQFVFLTASIAAAVFILFNQHLPTLFTDDPEVIATAARFLIITAIFQIVDQQQVTALGMLRGLQDVRLPTKIVVVNYWAVCLPLAWFLAFHTPLAGTGVWIALTIGLTLAAILLLSRLAFLIRSFSQNTP